MTATPADIAAIVERARRAQQDFERQAREERLATTPLDSCRAQQPALFDRAAQAVAWALLHPERNRSLAELAVATTGLGNVVDKVSKNHRKTLGLLRDLRGVVAYGDVSLPKKEGSEGEDFEQCGIEEVLRPKGVVAAIVPSTNPLATPANNAINALKTGNAIVLAPSPKGARALEQFLRYIHAEFDKAGIARDLVSMLPMPPSKEQTAVLLGLADFVVATGSANNVRAAVSCGTQAIGVGVGNVPVVVDETADLEHAASCIARSKTFDNATSCSAENALVVVSSVRAAFLEALAREGGWLLDEQQAQHLTATHWRDGKVQPALLAQDIAVVLERLGWTQLAPQGTRFLISPAEKVGAPLAGEKMALFLALYSVADFDAAASVAQSILEYQGAGHSVGLHSAKEERARLLAFALPTCRVIVNQPHAVATGGDFHNRLPFSLSMGCGSWGRNAIDENLHWRHFVNRVKIVRPVADREPALDEIFADYWSQVGKG